MNIDTATLASEVDRALRDWPFIVVAERGYSLPRFLLFAVGSRETNLTNEVGDGGHGHGVWQLDDRSHTIPGRFDVNVGWQCNTAAGMLAGLIGTFRGNLRAAVAAYNSGAGTVSWNLANGFDIDRGTAGNDYSRDVLERMSWLQSNHTYPPPPGSPLPAQPKDDDMRLVTDTDAQPELTLQVRGIDEVRVLQEDERAALTACGFPTERIDPALYQLLRARAHN